MEVARELQLVTAGVIGKVAFGYDLSIDDRKLMVESLELAYTEAFVDSQKNPVRKLVPFLFAGKRRAQQATRDLQSICRKMLKRQQQRNQEQAPLSTAASNQGSLLASMMEDRAYKNDEERIIDMVAYLAGGFDTVGYTMTWTMLELARNPDIQETLRTRLQEVKGDEKDRMQCTYLKHVIRESMRLHPVAAAGSIRLIDKAFHYHPKDDNDAINKQACDLIIPKKSIVLMPYFAIHRDSEVFNRPDEFLPQRWESPTSEMQSCWMGFALGRRNCKGQLLANIEMQLILSRLFGGDYEWSIVDPGHGEYSVTLKSIGTILKARKR